MRDVRGAVVSSSSSEGRMARTMEWRRASKTCVTTLSHSHHCLYAASSETVGSADNTGGKVGMRSGRGATPDAGGFDICPVYPKCWISARTPSFHAPKSVRPLRMGICVTVGKVLGECKVEGDTTGTTEGEKGRTEGKEDGTAVIGR